MIMKVQNDMLMKEMDGDIMTSLHIFLKVNFVTTSILNCINFISTSYEYFIQQQPSTISTSPALVFLSSFLPVQVLIILLTISHFTGCLWFAVGARNTSESTWVKVLGYDSQGVDAQYLAALHWALSQFLGEPIQ